MPLSLPVPPPARALTKTELMYETLRRGILTLRYPPGHYLNLDELARSHRLSPIPVREAVARLVAERLVVMRPHIGAEVAPLDETSVREVFAFLVGLETAAIPAIVARVTAADQAELARLVDRMDQLRLPRDLAQWDAANAEFHLRLSSIAGLTALVGHLRSTFDHWDRIRRHFFSAASDRRAQEAQREHRLMLRVLKAGSVGRLRALLIAHNQSALARYQRLLAVPRSASPRISPTN
jgi:DNA-binding GntR family transcriptional regulator